MKPSKAQYKQLVSNKTTHAPYTVFSTYTVHQFNNIEHVPDSTTAMYKTHNSIVPTTEYYKWSCTITDRTRFLWEAGHGDEIMTKTKVSNFGVCLGACSCWALHITVQPSTTAAQQQHTQDNNSKSASLAARTSPPPVCVCVQVYIVIVETECTGDCQGQSGTT